MPDSNGVFTNASEAYSYIESNAAAFFQGLAFLSNDDAIVSSIAGGFPDSLIQAEFQSLMGQHDSLMNLGDQVNMLWGQLQEAVTNTGNTIEDFFNWGGASWIQTGLPFSLGKLGACLAMPQAVIIGIIAAAGVILLTLAGALWNWLSGLKNYLNSRASAMTDVIGAINSGKIDAAQGQGLLQQINAQDAQIPSLGGTFTSLTNFVLVGSIAYFAYQWWKGSKA